MVKKSPEVLFKKVNTLFTKLVQSTNPRFAYINLLHPHPRGYILSYTFAHGHALPYQFQRLMISSVGGRIPSQEFESFKILRIKGILDFLNF